MVKVQKTGKLPANGNMRWIMNATADVGGGGGVKIAGDVMVIVKKNSQK